MTDKFSKDSVAMESSCQGTAVYMPSEQRLSVIILNSWGNQENSPGCPPPPPFPPLPIDVVFLEKAHTFKG